jgi:protein TonB
MKTMWAVLSARRPFTFILSISIHMLIFSIPVSMGIKPQIHDMELFVSLEDPRVPAEPVKKRMATKKPQPEPVKEMIKPIEPFYPKTQDPEIVEPIKEVMKEPSFIPPVSSVTEENSHEPAESGAMRMMSDVEKEPPIGHHVAGMNARNPIETRFGESVAPTFLHREMPVYPMIARKLGREGKVVLKLTIDEKGNLSDVEVIKKADYGFTEAAVEAAKKSTFLPAKKDGKPIASRALLPIRFKLERD